VVSSTGRTGEELKLLRRAVASGRCSRFVGSSTSPAQPSVYGICCIKRNSWLTAAKFVSPGMGKRCVAY